MQSAREELNMLGIEYIIIAFATLVISDIVSPTEDITPPTHESDK